MNQKSFHACLLLARTEKSNEVVKSSPLPAPRFDEENPHSTLMASIREAGGKAKLRAISLRTEQQVVLT